MSLLFNRAGIIEIATEDGGIGLQGLRFEFVSRKTRSSTPNSLFVRIYNPAPTTRATATDNEADIRLFAGYTGNIALVSEANIVTAVTLREPPNIILEIEAQEGIRALREEPVSISHGGGGTVRSVLDELRGILDIDERDTDADLSKAIRGGFSHVGKITRALDDLVSQINGYWSIQNNELLVLDEKGYVETDEVPLLTPFTGVVFSPEAVEKQLSSEQEDIEPRNGYRITTLMQPSIEPGDLVQIQTAEVSGEFLVDEVEHRGDIESPEWFSVITALEKE